MNDFNKRLEPDIDKDFAKPKEIEIVKTNRIKSIPNEMNIDMTFKNNLQNIGELEIANQTEEEKLLHKKRLRESTSKDNK